MFEIPEVEMFHKEIGTLNLHFLFNIGERHIFLPSKLLSLGEKVMEKNCLQQITGLKLMANISKRKPCLFFPESLMVIFYLDRIDL